MAAPVEPLLKPFETSAPPAAYERLDATLAAFMAERVPVESDAELRRRERVLGELKRVFQDWVQSVCRAKGLSDELAAEAGGRLYTSGSYRLGVHEPGADIDSVCVAPNHCTRTEFFDTLKAALLAHPQVENLRSVETAVVPIMTFDFDDVNIDLLFAHLPLNAIPAHLDIDEDAVLQGVDEATEKSLNGPRVTNLIYKLVAHNYPSFLAVLRVARVWAKKRGIYSNKMGYFGGVNFNILVALVCQLFPKATPSYLLCKFFHIFAKWDWPSPAILCRPVDHGYGFDVWGKHADQLRGRMAYANLRNNLMPIVTPAYPAMNSAANVNPWSYAVLQSEFERGSEICQAVVERHAALASDVDPSVARELWAPLVETTDFFDKYDAYLAVNILGDGDEGAFESFKGFLGSRLRKLVERLGYLPLKAIHLFPKEYDRATTPGLAAHESCYFLGLKEDRARMEGENFVLTQTWMQFWQEDVAKYRDLDDDLDVRLEHLAWEGLPDFVLGEDADAVAAARDVGAARRAVRHCREAEEALNDVEDAPNAALQALEKAEKADEAEGTLKRPRDDDDAAAGASRPKTETGATVSPYISLHDVTDDLPRLGAVLPAWHPLATTSRVPRAKKVVVELVDA
mmetsp:Transcript_6513/g.20203  ORF Transcript_6513/g.20203 Transcript_6513/m.20203 type:complete len:628 (+) Transcript_6513:262-2145(+)